MTINSSGLYTATEAVGSYTVRAAVGAVSGAASVAVTEAPLVGWSSEADLGGSGFVGLAASGTTVHLGYDSYTASLSYRRSSNSGASFATAVSLGAGTLYLEHPIAAEGTTAGIATVNAAFNLPDFYGSRMCGSISIRRSTDDGVTWSTAALASESAARAYRLSLVIKGLYWHLIWMDRRGSVGTTSPWHLYYNRSTDGGVTWQTTDTLLVTGTNETGAERPVIKCNGNDVHVAWMDGRDNRGACVIEGTTQIPNCTEVYYKKSTDNGASWGADVRLTNSTIDYAGRPDIAINGSNVVISYDFRSTTTSGNEIKVIRSGNGGTTWGSPISITSASGESTHSVVVDSATASKFYDIYNDNKTGSQHNYMKISTDGGATWGTEEQVSVSASGIPLMSEGSGYLQYIAGKSSTGTLVHRRKSI